MDKKLPQSQLRQSSLTKNNPLTISSSAKQIKNVQFTDYKQNLANRFKNMENKLHQIQTLAKKKSPQTFITESPIQQLEKQTKNNTNRDSQNQDNQLRGSCPLILAKHFVTQKNKLQKNKKSIFLPNNKFYYKSKEELNKTVEFKTTSFLSQSINFESRIKHSPIHKKISNFRSNISLAQSLTTSRKLSISNPVIQGFYLIKLLGKGKFGQVHLARHVKTNFIVALKIINKSKIRDFNMIQQIKNEIKIHSAMQHSHIVKFYGLLQGPNEIYFILEYMHGGTLFDLLNLKQYLKPSEAAQYLKDIVSAVNYMHNLSIAHRDIKPQNIVLFEGTVKICDFGWSAVVNSVRKTYCGTLDYAPPQILERKQYDISVDIWCLGVLAYQLMTGRAPFESEKRSEVKQKILNVHNHQQRWGNKNYNFPVIYHRRQSILLNFYYKKILRNDQKSDRLEHISFFSYFAKLIRRTRNFFTDFNNNVFYLYQINNFTKAIDQLLISILTLLANQGLALCCYMNSKDS